MTEERQGRLDEREDDLLIRFLAKTKSGEYAIIDESYLSYMRIEAQAMDIDDKEYYCSTG